MHEDNIKLVRLDILVTMVFPTKGEKLFILRVHVTCFYFLIKSQEN